MLAVLYDIHGNLPALEAVLEDAEAAGATDHQLGGDYAAFGAWPMACVERLRALPDARWIRGNWERWQTDPSAAPDTEVIQGAAAAVIAALGDEVVADLGALPGADERDGTLFCHGSPGSDMDSFLPEPSEEDDQLLAGVTARRVVFGHTHVQFRRRSPGGIDLLNPGSVGLPWDGDVRAAYALIGDDGEVELRRVAYDHEAAAAALEDRGQPWAEITARRLRAARFDV
jgi:diadenosine tetraphosphatase ApaH/serine/threonine PP2A family protein phosphatase